MDLYYSSDLVFPVDEEGQVLIHVRKAQLLLLSFPIRAVESAVFSFLRLEDHLLKLNVTVGQLVADRLANTSKLSEAEDRLDLVNINHSCDGSHTLPEL